MIILFSVFLLISPNMEFFLAAAHAFVSDAEVNEQALLLCIFLLLECDPEVTLKFPKREMIFLIVFV